MRENTPTSNVSGRRPRHPSGGMIAVNSWCSKVPVTPGTRRTGGIQGYSSSADANQKSSCSGDWPVRARRRFHGWIPQLAKALRESRQALCSSSRIGLGRKPGAGDVLGPAFCDLRALRFLRESALGRSDWDAEGWAGCDVARDHQPRQLRVTDAEGWAGCDVARARESAGVDAKAQGHGTPKAGPVATSLVTVAPKTRLRGASRASSPSRAPTGGASPPDGNGRPSRAGDRSRARL